jgi:hypothetical protein
VFVRCLPREPSKLGLANMHHRVVTALVVNVRVLLEMLPSTTTSSP